MTVSSRESVPASISSAISSSVITFVTLAGRQRVCASFSYSTSPVAFSISTAHGADTLGITPGVAGAAQAAAPGRARSTAAVRIKQKIRLISI